MGMNRMDDDSELCERQLAHARIDEAQTMMTAAARHLPRNVTSMQVMIEYDDGQQLKIDLSEVERETVEEEKRGLLQRIFRRG